MPNVSIDPGPKQKSDRTFIELPNIFHLKTELRTSPDQQPLRSELGRGGKEQNATQKTRIPRKHTQRTSGKNTGGYSFYEENTTQKQRSTIDRCRDNRHYLHCDLAPPPEYPHGECLQIQQKEMDPTSLIHSQSFILMNRVL